MSSKFFGNSKAIVSTNNKSNKKIKPGSMKIASRSIRKTGRGN